MSKELTIESRTNPETSRREMRVTIAGTAGEARSGWWWVDDGSAEQDASLRYRKLEQRGAPTEAP